YNADVKTPVPTQAIRFVVVGAVVAAITALGFRLHVNHTTVALMFLVAVLLASAYWGLRYAVVLAVGATAAFNFFFLPPVGTFTIADPQNWVALFAFLVTAMIASQLSARASREALNANDRRHDVERLYSFSQKLLTSDNVVELLNLLPRYIVDAFGVKAAAISLPDRGDVYRSTPDIGSLDAHDLQLVCSRGEPRIDSQKQLAFVPLRM